jgi:hypothetical protein
MVQFGWTSLLPRLRQKGPRQSLRFPQTGALEQHPPDSAGLIPRRRSNPRRCGFGHGKADPRGTTQNKNAFVFECHVPAFLRCLIRMQFLTSFCNARLECACSCRVVLRTIEPGDTKETFTHDQPCSSRSRHFMDACWLWIAIVPKSRLGTARHCRRLSTVVLVRPEAESCGASFTACSEPRYSARLVGWSPLQEIGLKAHRRQSRRSICSSVTTISLQLATLSRRRPTNY